MFQVDFYILIVRLLPPFLRKPKMIAWLYCLSTPIIALHGTFLSFRADTLMRMSITGQVISLEWLLNELFDPTGQGIYIESNPIALTNNYVYSDVNTAPPNYVYSETDAGAVPFYLYTEADFLNIIHFTIYVPIALSFDSIMLEAVVNYYKLSGKKFNIQTY